MYSKPRLLMTSTMKSEPGFSIVLASSTAIVAGAAAGRPSTGAEALRGACAISCAFPVPGLATAIAALAAAVFRNLRRSSGLTFVFLAIAGHLGPDSIKSSSGHRA